MTWRATSGRPTEQALNHPFFKVDPAELEAMVAMMGPDKTKKSGGGGIFGMFGGGRERREREEREREEKEEEEFDNVEEGVTNTRGMLSDMFSLEKRISRQQDIIAVQSTTVMRLKSAGAPPAEVDAEQKTLEKMRVGLQGLLRSFSFSQVEARTTMVKAATQIQKQATEVGGTHHFCSPRRRTHVDSYFLVLYGIL